MWEQRWGKWTHSGCGESWRFARKGFERKRRDKQKLGFWLEPRRAVFCGERESDSPTARPVHVLQRSLDSKVWMPELVLRCALWKSQFRFSFRRTQPNHPMQIRIQALLKGRNALQGPSSPFQSRQHQDFFYMQLKACLVYVCPSLWVCQCVVKAGCALHLLLTFYLVTCWVAAAWKPKNILLFRDHHPYLSSLGKRNLVKAAPCADTDWPDHKVSRSGTLGNEWRRTSAACPTWLSCPKSHSVLKEAGELWTPRFKGVVAWILLKNSAQSLSQYLDINPVCPPPHAF